MEDLFQTLIARSRGVARVVKLRSATAFSEPVESEADSTLEPELFEPSTPMADAQPIEAGRASLAADSVESPALATDSVTGRMMPAEPPSLSATETQENSIAAASFEAQQSAPSLVERSAAPDRVFDQPNVQLGESSDHPSDISPRTSPTLLQAVSVFQNESDSADPVPATEQPPVSEPSLVTPTLEPLSAPPPGSTRVASLDSTFSEAAVASPTGFEPATQELHKRIEIKIGRIEVRVERPSRPAPASRRSSSPRRPAQSLSDYLKSRRKG